MGLSMGLGIGRRSGKSVSWPLATGAGLLACALAMPAQAFCERHNSFDKEAEQQLDDVVKGLASKKVERYLARLLTAIDREVYEHEQAHYQAGGGWVLLPTYKMVRFGGKEYRVGGCVKPKRNIPAHIGYKAALAPEHPSHQDRRMAEDYKARIGGSVRPQKVE